LIPAFNEADIIGDTIKAALLAPGVTQVIVIDDASSDDTSFIANSSGANNVIRVEENLGKGGALNRGLALATGSVLLLLDADLGDSARDAAKILQPVLDGSADMTIALFQSNQLADGQGFSARSGGFGLAVKTARCGIKLLTGQSFRAPLSGQRAVKREIIDKAGGFAQRYGVEVGLTIDALRLGYRVAEVPVNMAHRGSGRDLAGFIHRGRQFLDVVRTIACKAWNR
jgi:glycosyltransferase involved in cell wall biosynthesis